MRGLICILIGSGVGLVKAAEPALTHIHPAGVQTGKVTEVVMSGKFEPWPCRVWADVAGIEFVPGKEAGKYAVTVGAGVVPGPHLIRVYNDDGVSLPVALAVDGREQTAEVEPNDDIRKPQVLGSAGAVCNGRLDKSGDVDLYRVSLRAGRVLTARVEATVLAAGCDMMLRVTDAAGVTVAFNHDHVSMDPLVVWRVERDGDYVIQVSGHRYPASTELNFAGGADGIYRLHVSDGPVVRHVWPLGVARVEKPRVKVEGWNLEGGEMEIDPVRPPCPVMWSVIPEVEEAVEKVVLAVPTAVSGRLAVRGEEDRYPFEVKKGEVRVLTVTGPTHDSLIDPLVRILGSDGKELVSGDDNGVSREPVVTWTAPEAGTYFAAVSDLTKQGGEDYFYRLEMNVPVPTVSAVAAGHAVRVEAGKSGEVKTTVTLGGGYAKRLQVVVKGLPEGVSAAAVDVPEKGGEVVVAIKAEAGAGRYAGPIRVVLREVEGGMERAVRFPLNSVAENNGVPQGFPVLLVNETEQLWLSVVPAAVAAPAAEAPKAP
jgi:hypothetical protein